MRDCCGIMVVNKPLIRPDLFWNINHLVSVHGATPNLFGFIIYDLYSTMVVSTHLRNLLPPNEGENKEIFENTTADKMIASDFFELLPVTKSEQ